MATPCPSRAIKRRPRRLGITDPAALVALFAALIGALLTGTAGADDAPITPFQQDYRLKAQGYPFTVAARRTLTETADGVWKMEVRASNFLGEIRETSEFIWRDCTPVTREYRYRREGLGRVKSAQLSIDTQERRARAQSRGSEAYGFDTGEATTDPIALTLALQCHLARGETEITLDVAETDRETQHYQVVGEETLKLGDTEVNAVKVQRQRGKNSERQTWLWFAPDAGHALVQLVQENSDGHHVMTLESPL